MGALFQMRSRSIRRGDRFLGLPNPAVRGVVRSCRDTVPEEAFKLLQSPWHEIRLCGLLLVRCYSGGDESVREAVYRGYLAHTERINNWDLTDLSAPGIVGEHLLNREPCPGFTGWRPVLSSGNSALRWFRP